MSDSVRPWHLVTCFFLGKNQAKHGSDVAAADPKSDVGTLAQHKAGLARVLPGILELFLCHGCYRGNIGLSGVQSWK